MTRPGIDVLYEEGPCLVVNKPSGLLTQAPPGIDSLEVRIKTLLNEREPRPYPAYLGVPHRLDRPVSGAMVFALNRRAAFKLSRQFERRTVKKLYWALVAGKVEPELGTWTDYLYKVHGQPRAIVVDQAHPDGQHAVLHYRVLSQADEQTLLEIELETGRTHQIRVQAASRGHVVIGDAHYGSMLPFGDLLDDERARPIALHARLLEFEHPKSKEAVSITAPLPPVWHAYIDQR
jgi:RluA family pseudouridine synthase